MPRQRQKRKRNEATSIRPIDSKKQKYSKDGWRRVSWSEYVGFSLKNAELSDEESGDDEHGIIRNEPTNRRLDLESAVATASGGDSASKNVPPLWVQNMKTDIAASDERVPKVQEQTANHSAEVLPLPSLPQRKNRSKDNNLTTEEGGNNGGDATVTHESVVNKHNEHNRLQKDMTLVGATSGLPLPTIDLEAELEEVPLSTSTVVPPEYLDVSYIDSLLETYPKLEEEARKSKYSNGNCKAYWESFRKNNPHLQDAQVSKIQKKLRDRQQQLKKKALAEQSSCSGSDGLKTADAVAGNKDGTNDMDCSHSSGEATNKHASLSAQPDPSAGLPDNESSQSGPEQSAALACFVAENNPAGEGTGNIDRHNTDEDRIRQERVQRVVDDFVSKIDPLQPNDEDDEEAEAEKTKAVGITLKACKSYWQKQFSMPKLEYKALFEEALSKILAICTWFEINGRSPACSKNVGAGVVATKIISPADSSCEDGDSQDNKENMTKNNNGGSVDAVGNGVAKESLPTQSKFSGSRDDQKHAINGGAFMKEAVTKSNNTADEDSSESFYSVVEENEESPASDASRSNSSYVTATKGKRDSTDSLSSAGSENHTIAGAGKVVSGNILPKRSPAHGTTNMRKSSASTSSKTEPAKKSNKKDNGASAKNVKQPAGEKEKEEAADNVIEILDSDDDDEDASPQISNKDDGNDSDSEIIECWVASDKKQSIEPKKTAAKGSGGSVKAE